MILIIAAVWTFLKIPCKHQKHPSADVVTQNGRKFDKDAVNMLCQYSRIYINIYRLSIYNDTPKTYEKQVSRHLTENKKDKSRWLP